MQENTDIIKLSNELIYQRHLFNREHRKDVFMKLIPSIIKKIILVIIALIVSIPFLIKFPFQNKFNLWILEFLLWIVWIYQSLDLESFKTLMREVKK